MISLQQSYLVGSFRLAIERLKRKSTEISVDYRNLELYQAVQKSLGYITHEILKKNKKDLFIIWSYHSRAYMYNYEFTICLYMLLSVADPEFDPPWIC